jgi:hypothetical protein
MSCPATTVGRVMIIFSISRLNNKSSATLAANKDLPEPALPRNMVTVLVKILDLARAVCKNCNIKYTGIRPGEKLHEEMISSYDARNTVDAKAYYIILHENLFRNYKNKKLVNSNFYYRSDTNKNFLDVQGLKRIISNI